jgi:hypothetical protein
MIVQCDGFQRQSLGMSATISSRRCRPGVEQLPDGFGQPKVDDLLKGEPLGSLKISRE